MMGAVGLRAQTLGVPTVGTVTQGYLNPNSQEPGGLHRGVDIAGGAPSIDNTVPVYAAGAGKVVFVGYSNPGLGWFVVVYHGLIGGKHVYSFYGHMGNKARGSNPDASFIAPSVQPGLDVVPGTYLGRQGNAGSTYSTSGGLGVHLHWEVRISDTPLLDKDGSLLWASNREYDIPDVNPGDYAGMSLQNGTSITTPVAPDALTASGTWHPTGTLIQESGDPAVWLVVGGQRRLIPPPTEGYLFNWNRIITVSISEMGCLSRGPDLPDQRTRRILTGPSGTVYLVTDHGVFAFASAAAYRGLGYSWNQISGSQPDDPTASVIASPWSDGTLIKKQGDPAVYVIANGLRAGPLTLSAFQRLGYSFHHVIELDAGQFGAIGGDNTVIQESDTERCGVTTSTTGTTLTLVASCAANPAHVMVNERTTFSSTVSGGVPPYRFSWTQNGTSIASTQNATLAYASPGTYTLDLHVTDSSTPALTGTASCPVTVESAGGGAPAFGVSASVVTAPIIAGQPVNFSVTIRNTGSGAAAGVLVDPEINNANNQRVFQAPALTGQDFGPGTSKTYTVTWTPPDARPYTLKIGVFASGWSALLFWADQAATFTPGTTPAGPTGGTASIWWPAPNGITLSGTQPLKARLEGAGLDSYLAYWQVDGGGLVPMSDSHDPANPFADHKEALVDFSGWTWRGGTNGRYGPYVINFVFQTLGGALITQQSATVYVTK